MPFADNPIRSNTTEDRRYSVGITGTGAANPTKNFGDGIGVARQDEGVYRFTFLNFYGAFKGVDVRQLRAVTVANVKQCTVTCGVPTAAVGTTPGFVDVQLWGAAGAARDLAADEFMELEFCFAGMGG